MLSLCVICVLFCFVFVDCNVDSSRPPSSSIPSVDSSKPISNVNMQIPNQLSLNLNATTAITTNTANTNDKTINKSQSHTHKKKQHKMKYRYQSRG